MSRLDEKVQNVLNRARSIHDATDLDRQRALRKLRDNLPLLVGTSAVGVAAFRGSEALAQTGGGFGSKVVIVGKETAGGLAGASLSPGSAIAVKAAAIVTAASIAGAASFGAGFYTGRVTAPEPGEIRPSADAVHVERTPRVSSGGDTGIKLPIDSPEPPPASAADVSLPSPVRPSATPPRPPRQIVADKQEPEHTETGPLTLGDEIVLLRRAQRALQQGSPRLALLLVDELTGLYPSGALREEATVVRVLALCNLGKTAEAEAAARIVLQRNPRSVHASRLRSSCASSPTAQSKQDSEP